MKRQGSALLMVIIVLLIAVGLAAVVYTARSGHSVNEPAKSTSNLAIEKYLPDNTLFLISFPDVSLMRERLKKTNLYSLWNDEEVQFALKPFMDMLKKGIVNDIKESTGLELEEAIDLLHCQVAIAVIDVPLINPGMPDVVFSIDAGKYKDKMLNVIKHIQKKEKEKDSNLKETVSNFKGVEVTSFGAIGSQMQYAFLDTLLVVTWHKDRIEKIIAGYVEKPVNGLSSDALFSKVHSKINGNEDLLVYCNIKEIIKRYNKLIPEDARKSMDALGVYGIDAIGGSMAFLPPSAEGPCQSPRIPQSGTGCGAGPDGMVKENVFIATSGAPKGLTKILLLSPKTNKLSKYIPADAILCSHINIDLKATWNEIVNICKAIPPISGKVDDFLAELDKKVGFSLPNDLLATFGNEMVSYGIFPEGGGLLPDGIFIAELKDKGKFEQCVKSLANNLNGSLEEITFHGTKINYLRYQKIKVPFENRHHGLFGKLNEMQGVNETVIYFIKDNVLFASGAMHPIKRAIMRMEQEFDGIDKNEAFDYLAKSIDPASQMFMYIDTARFFKPSYNTVLSAGQHFQDVLRVLVANKLPGLAFLANLIDFNKFPTSEAIARYLGQTIVACSSDKDGIKIESYSGVGIGPVSIAGVAIVAAIAIPNMLSSRLGGNEASAIGCLKALMSAEMVWRQRDADGNDVQDYWTKDVSCLYRMCIGDSETPVALISVDIAKADGTPYKEGKKGDIGNRKIVGIPQFVPKAGYFFEAMKFDEEGNSYQQNPDEDEYKHSNQYKFAFVAYPAEYGKTGNRVFIINELGMVYAIDPGSDRDKIIVRWPGKDPTTITGPCGKCWSVAGN